MASFIVFSHPSLEKGMTKREDETVVYGGRAMG